LTGLAAVARTGSTTIVRDGCDRLTTPRVRLWHTSHDGLPEDVAPGDNEQGWNAALARFAALVGAKP
jgi:hypothetical protein